MILLIAFCFIGLICLVYSTIQWKKIVECRVLNKDLIIERKKFKYFSTFSMIILMCSMLSIFGQGIDTIAIGAIIGMTFCFNKLWFEPYYTAEDVKNIDRLCLYLRPFAIDGHVSKNNSVRGLLPIPETIEECICV